MKEKRKSINANTEMAEILDSLTRILKLPSQKCCSEHV